MRNETKITAKTVLKCRKTGIKPCRTNHQNTNFKYFTLTQNNISNILGFFHQYNIFI